MFITKINLAAAESAPPASVASLLQPIKQSKYPGTHSLFIYFVPRLLTLSAITTEEESVSIPLQIVCQALFDAILVHLMNTLPTSKTVLNPLPPSSSTDSLTYARVGVATHAQRYL